LVEQGAMSAGERRWHDALTLGDLLVRAVERDAESEAIVFPDGLRRSYGDLYAGAEAAARSLAALGVDKGSHVGILMPNCIDFLETFFGAALLGAVAVPINARFKPRELCHVVADGDVEVLVTSDLIAEHVDYVSLLHETLDGLADAADPLALSLSPVPRLRSVVLLGSRPAAGMVDRETFEQLAARTPEDDVDARRARVAMRDVALMMYTSGTTAMPRGCPLSHEALVRTAVVAGRTRFRLTARDRFWDPLPMFHMSAILPLIGVMDAGAAFLSMTHFEADAALEMLDDERATVSFATFPAITQALLNHPGYDRDRWRRIRLINNVAPADTMRAMQAEMPHTVQISAYGCTECAGVVSFSDPDETPEQRATMCGRPFDGIELAIRDLETGRPAATGERGEIVVRGYNLFEGYYKDPELTSARIDAEGWFHTGDIGALDPEGRVSYLGRTKDMLKVGGENVAAVEIESHLGTHPAVSIVAVVGVPDPKYMEVAAAFVELRPGREASAEELLEHCRQGLARFKVPRYVRFVEEWPMSATKIQKFRLAEQLARELEAERAGVAADV
jgi:fatty-acyl-CoA synthase